MNLTNLNTMLSIEITMSSIIYKIWSEKGDKIYVGSTGKQYLSNRKADHLSKYRLKTGNRCSSYDLFDEYGVENCIFEEIDRASTQEERFMKERQWIAELNAINIQRNPRQSKEEKKQYFAERFQKIKNEPEKYKERNRKNYLARKEVRSQSVLCECGKTYTIQHKKRHMETAFHLSKVNKA